MYYSRVTHQRVARKNIDVKYVDDVLDKHLDPLDMAKRFGGAWFLNDETGTISKEPPPNHDHTEWSHTFHSLPGMIVLEPRITTLGMGAICNGYMFISNSRQDAQHAGGMEIFFNHVSRNVHRCSAVTNHNAGG